jgi:hypothetical protein
MSKETRVHFEKTAKATAKDIVSVVMHTVDQEEALERVVGHLFGTMRGAWHVGSREGQERL